MPEAIAIVATALLAGLGALVVRIMKASAADKRAASEQADQSRRADMAQLAELIRGNTASNTKLAAMIRKIDHDHEGGHDVT